MELALVLFILALVLGGLLAPLSTRIEQRDRNATEQVLDEIKESILGFAVVNKRLPCPDTDNDGDENCAGMSGTFAVGTLPWIDLGVGEFDAWGRPFRYAVNVQFADNTDGTGLCTPTLNVSFTLCSIGTINVLDAAGGTAVVSGVPALVLSTGSNGGVAPSSNHEIENIDGDNVFVLKSYSRDGANEFDDLLTWISPAVLMNRMVVAGRLP